MRAVKAKVSPPTHLSHTGGTGQSKGHEEQRYKTIAGGQASCPLGDTAFSGSLKEGVQCMRQGIG